MADKISFTAVGDCFITRCAPENDPDLQKLSEIITKNDVRIANLEVSLNDGDVFPSAICGGTWAKAKPEVLTTIQAYGFNGVGWANNHTLDYLHDGVLTTKFHLDQSGMIHAGAGENLSEASSPKYFETANGRVAFISCATTAPVDWIAGDQRKDCIGRPGLNLLRTQKIISVSKSEMMFLDELAEALYLNAEIELSIEHGFDRKMASDIHLFGNLFFKEGEIRSSEVDIVSVDQKRVLNSIIQGKQSADYVLVSLHAHEFYERQIEKPAEFLVQFAHDCIDIGADAIIGHGPHVLRGIEVYKNKPIFYSLGNFIYQPDTATNQPADMYEKYDLSPDKNVVDVFNAVRTSAKFGHAEIKEMGQSVLPVWQMEEGSLNEITLYPIDLGFDLPSYRMGWPTLSKNDDILESLEKLCIPFGTNLEINQGIGIIRF